MCWQRPTLALFQLHGIKHSRYARQMVFIERGKRGESGLQSPCPPLPVKAGLVLLQNHCKTKESGSLANSCVFSNTAISFFIPLTKLC